MISYLTPALLKIAMRMLPEHTQMFQFFFVVFVVARLQDYFRLREETLLHL